MNDVISNITEMSLTAEQLDRIARNKAEAKRRMAARQQREAFVLREQPSTSAVNVGRHESEQSGPKVFIEYRKISPVKRQQAVNIPPSVQTTYRSTVPSSSNYYHGLQPLKNASVDSQEVLVTYPEKKRALVSVNFSLVGLDEFQVHFIPFSKEVVEALRSIPSKRYDPVKKVWLYPFDDLEAVEKQLLSLNNVEAEIEKPSTGIAKALRSYLEKDTGKEIQLERNIDQTLLDALFPYQRRGVMFGVSRRGRILLADEMGLGKSIQALGIAHFFSCDWPLLIVCPSSVKFSWCNQIELFLPSVTDISIIEKGNDRFPVKKTTKTVIIMSYDLMVSKKNHIIEYGFKAIIFDESHLLKDGQAQRTKVATEISRKALRAMLLTGTPALSRPAELYSQVRIIDPKIFPTFRDFAIRYCDGKQGRFAFEAKGCTNSEELSVILTGTIMLRRLKKDVLEDLPEKRQEVVHLNDESIYINIAKLRAAKAAYSGAKDNDTKQQHLVEYYYETGLAKAFCVAKYIINQYFYDDAPKKKVLIFAHHQVVMDTISMELAKKGLRAIRIDGTTPSKSREEQCRLFQNNEDVVVAVLSMTAAGMGITLTAASVVIFAELHWNPGTMKQAEDRAHRVGQRDSVFVQYLLANGTADDILWPLVQKKLDVLQSCNLSADTYRSADQVQKVMRSEDGSLERYFPNVKRSKVDNPFEDDL